MRFSILGYSQRRLLQLGLGMDEAMLLRWFVEYQATGRMRSMVIEGRAFTWVNFCGVLEDLPVVGGSPRTVSRRFDRLEAAGVMERRIVREGGVYSYFRLREDVYMSLIDDVAAMATQAAKDRADGLTELSKGMPIPTGDSYAEGGIVRSTGMILVSSGPQDAPDGRSEVSNGGVDGSEGPTELSDGLTEMTDRLTNLSEQMIHTQDTITRHIIPPIIPQTGSPVSKGRKTDDPFIPQAIQGIYREALGDFIAFRRETRNPMTQRAVDLAVEKLSTLPGDRERVACIRQSIEAGYRGLFPERFQGQSRFSTNLGKPSQRRLASEADWQEYFKSHGKEA